MEENEGGWKRAAKGAKAGPALSCTSTLAMGKKDGPAPPPSPPEGSRRPWGKKSVACRGNLSPDSALDWGGDRPGSGSCLCFGDSVKGALVPGRKSGRRGKAAPPRTWGSCWVGTNHGSVSNGLASPLRQLLPSEESHEESRRPERPGAPQAGFGGWRRGLLSPQRLRMGCAHGRG